MNNSLLAQAGPVAVCVIGGSPAAISISTIIVATGGAALLALAGYGIYRYLEASSPAEHAGKIP